MARKISLLRALLFSLGVGSALAFGAGTALADGAASACEDPAAQGICYNWYDCKKLCQRIGYSGIEAHCVSGCCYCGVTRATTR
jgi:hypothetical protein